MQELLRPDKGMLVFVLGLFSQGIVPVMLWTHPCAMLARTAVKLLAAMPAPVTNDADTTWKLSAWLLGTVGQVWTPARLITCLSSPQPPLKSWSELVIHLWLKCHLRAAQACLSIHIVICKGRQIETLQESSCAAGP